jgi:hypothetical protein
MDKLYIEERMNVNGPDEHEIVREVTSGLTNNTKLRGLRLLFILSEGMENVCLIS